MVEKEWISATTVDSNTVVKLATALSVPNTIASILVQRGIDDYEKAFKYFKPQIADLYDPFLMKDMQLAVNRLHQAIATKERILVYGDYDVDGTTSVAMLYMFLQKRNAEIEFYIPDRYSEGYGVSRKGVEYAIAQKFSLIITLDCGIKAINEIGFAHENDIDVIVCDHHNQGAELPAAYAILDPKQTDCNYPFKELSGCGVGFKLIHAYCLQYNLNLKEELFCYLDIVTISIASDIVPIVDENRIIAYFGLKKLSQKPQTGVRALLELAGIAGVDMTINDLVFKVGPRINAAGRIETGKTAVKLLIASNSNDAKIICEQINLNNDDRKTIDKIITDEALHMIHTSEVQRNKFSTVLYNEQWHKGVVGIVASRLTEHYYRPTIVLTLSNGLVTGSARSVDGFDLYAAIETCADLLTNFGGHKYAAGISMVPENLDSFITRFEQTVQLTIEPWMMKPKVHIDQNIDFDDITNDFYRILKQFEPFGPGNMTPVFAVHNIYDSGNSRTVGQDKEHLKLSLMQHNTVQQFDGIAFGMGHMYESIKNHNFNACFSLSENTFRGITKLQLEVKDIQIDN